MLIESLAINLLIHLALYYSTKWSTKNGAVQVELYLFINFVDSVFGAYIYSTKLVHKSESQGCYSGDLFQ